MAYTHRSLIRHNQFRLLIDVIIIDLQAKPIIQCKHNIAVLFVFALYIDFYIPYKICSCDIIMFTEEIKHALGIDFLCF